MTEENHDMNIMQGEIDKLSKKIRTLKNKKVPSSVIHSAVQDLLNARALFMEKFGKNPAPSTEESSQNESRPGDYVRREGPERKI